jgi:putative PIN family toxin of toxin-antitoxin system
MNVVIDTNVIVSGVINPDGYPAKLLNWVINGTLKINVDSRILSEYSRVLNSHKFSFPGALVTHLLDYLSLESKLILPDPFLSSVKDSSDLPFIEIALHENIPLITGNKKHFINIKNLKLYSPKEFLTGFSSREE